MTQRARNGQAHIEMKHMKHTRGQHVAGCRLQVSQHVAAVEATSGITYQTQGKLIDW